MDKQYILLKDLPNLKSGAIFSYDEITDSYRHESELGFAGFSAGIVEHRPEWFSLLSNDEPINPCAWWSR